MTAPLEPYRPRGAYYTPLPVARAIVARWASVFAHQLRTPEGLRILDPSVGGGAFPAALLELGLVASPLHLEVMDLDPDCRGMRTGIGIATMARATDHPVRTGFLVTHPAQVPHLVIGNPPFGVPRPPELCDRCEGHGTIQIRGVWDSDATYQRTVTRRCPKCKGAGMREFKRPIPVAEEHIRRALDVSSRWVLFLLRLGMLEAAERADLWASTPLRHVDVLTSRPEFSAVCTECAGTGWGEGGDGEEVPPCPPCEGTGKISGQGGTDATPYGAFLWDKEHTGPPTIGWLRD